jgi:hypothetical protein
MLPQRLGLDWGWKIAKSFTYEYWAVTPPSPHGLSSDSSVPRRWRSGRGEMSINRACDGKRDWYYSFRLGILRATV